MIRLNVIGQKELRNISDLIRSHTMTLSLSVTIGICVMTIGALAVAQTYFNITLSTVVDELSSTKIVSPAGETLPVLELTNTINEQLAVLEAPLVDYHFDAVLIDVANATPSGISYTSISISTKTSELAAQGFATSRNEVPILESSLTKMPYLTDVVIQSSLNERTRIPVTITATIDTTKFRNP